MWTLVLCLAVSSSLQLTIATSPSLEDVHSLLQAVEFHHDNYKRSLLDLDVMLDKLPRDQLMQLKEKTRRSKRSEVGQLFNSFLAFCGTLKNEYTTKTHSNVGEKPSVASVQTYDKNRSNKSLAVYSRIWKKQTVPFRILNLRTRRFSKQFVVEVTVEFSVPLSYYTLPTRHIEVRPMGKKHLNNPDNSSRISRFKFKFGLKNCLKSKHYIPRGEIVQIQITGRDFDSKMISINLFPCRGSENSNVWKEFNLNDDNAIDLTLPNNVITTEKGKKTLFEVQFENTEVNFDLSTIEYHRDTSSFVYSETYVDLDSSRGGPPRRDPPRKGPSGNYPPSEPRCNSDNHRRVFGGKENITFLVDVKLCRKDNRNQSDAKENKENNQPPIAEIIVDTVDDTKSGIFWLGVSKNLENREDRNSVFNSLAYFIPIIVAETPKQNPLPSDKMLFIGKQEFMCNTNPILIKEGFDEAGYCSLVCLVFNGDIASLTIVQNEKDFSLKNSGEYSFTSVVGASTAKATLKFNKKERRFAGNYSCRATSKSGHTEERAMTLAVGAVPFIQDGEVHVHRDDDNDQVRINCTASGNDLEISVYANEIKPELRLDNDPDVRANFAQISPDHKSLLLDVPLSKVDMHYEIVCLAENNLANMTKSALVPSANSPGGNYTMDYGYDY